MRFDFCHSRRKVEKPKKTTTLFFERNTPVLAARRAWLLRGGRVAASFGALGMLPSVGDGDDRGGSRVDRPNLDPSERGVEIAIASTSAQTREKEKEDIATMTFPAFPHTPYGIQLDLMRSLYGTLQRGGIGVFESPTGTGKTLSVLCSALQWLEDEKRSAMQGAGNFDGDKNKDDDKNTKGSADPEPDWLVDFEHNKRTRDFVDKEQRRHESRVKARRRAEEKDVVFFSQRLPKRALSGEGGFRPGRKNNGKETAEHCAEPKSKSSAERAAVAAYAAAVARGASRDEAVEEAEFLADDWSDENGGGKNTGTRCAFPKSGASPRSHARLTLCFTYRKTRI